MARLALLLVVVPRLFVATPAPTPRPLASDCPAGTHAAAGASECSPCGVDTYSAAGASACTACPSEFPVAEAGASECHAAYCGGDAACATLRTAAACGDAAAHVGADAGKTCAWSGPVATPAPTPRPTHAYCGGDAGCETYHGAEACANANAVLGLRCAWSGPTPAPRTAAPTVQPPTASRYPTDWGQLDHCLHPTKAGGLQNYELRTCGAGETTAFARDATIAVVGGGAGGLSVAKLLADRGFTGVTVFEKEGRVGGKSKTWVDDNDATKTPHELGACYMTGKYECVQAWLNEVGAGWFAAPSDRVMHDDADLGLTGAATMPFASWLAGRALKDHGVATADFKATLAAEIHHYLAAYTAAFGSGEWMFPSDQSEVDFADLDCTFAAWLEKHEFKALVPFFLLSLSIQGYGNIDTTPAFLGLMWHHPNLVAAFAWEEPVLMLDDGFQAFWEKVAAKTHFLLRLDHEVTSIQRTDAAVTIAYTDATGAARSSDFDILFMAAPMPDALSLFAAPTPNELTLLSSFYEHEFSIVLHTVAAAKDGDASEVFSETAPHFVSNAATAGEQEDWFSRTRLRDGRFVDAAVAYDALDAPYSVRKDWALYGTAAAVPLTMTSIIHPPEATRAALEADIVAYFATFESTNEVVHWERWTNYFPRYNASAIVDAKFPWKLWAAQGEMRTFHVGSFASFESVADVLDYGLQLVNAKLCDPAPTPAPHPRASARVTDDDDANDEDGSWFQPVAFMLGFFCACAVLLAIFFYARRAKNSGPPNLEADVNYATEMT